MQIITKKKVISFSGLWLRVLGYREWMTEDKNGGPCIYMLADATLLQR